MLRLAVFGLAIITAAPLSLVVSIWVCVFSGKSRMLAMHGRWVARMLEALGPTAVKLGQIASSRADLLPSTLVESLRRLQDNTAVPSTAAVRRLVRDSLSPHLLNAFRHINHEPIAAGSIAVVLKGETSDGRQVAIKLLRPGIRRRLQRDLDSYRFIVRLVGKLPPLKAVPVVDVYDHLARMVEGQCDLIKEGATACQLAPALAAWVQIPVPYADLSSHTVLTTSHLPGRYKLLDADLPEQQYREAAVQLVRALYQMIFVCGVVHCDLHPGNVAVTDDGRPILYDFGLIGELSTVDRCRFRDFFIAFAKGNVEAVTQNMITSAATTPANLDRAELRNDVERLLRRHTGQSAGNFAVALFVKEVFEIQHRHRMFGSPAFVSAIWALGVMEGLVRHRFPDLDFQSMAHGFVASAIIDEMRLANV